MTLGVLALATIERIRQLSTGDGATALRTDQSRWWRRPPDVAANYAEIAGIDAGNVTQMNCGFAPQVVLDVQDVQNDVQAEVQARLAVRKRTLVQPSGSTGSLAGHQSQLRTVERAPRTIAWPEPHIVVEVPELPEIPEY